MARPQRHEIVIRYSSQADRAGKPWGAHWREIAHGARQRRALFFATEAEAQDFKARIEQAIT